MADHLYTQNLPFSAEPEEEPEEEVQSKKEDEEGGQEKKENEADSLKKKKSPKKKKSQKARKREQAQKLKDMEKRDNEGVSDPDAEAWGATNDVKTLEKHLENMAALRTSGEDPEYFAAVDQCTQFLSERMCFSIKCGDGEEMHLTVTELLKLKSLGFDISLRDIWPAMIPIPTPTSSSVSSTQPLTGAIAMAHMQPEFLAVMRKEFKVINEKLSTLEKDETKSGPSK